MSMFYDPDFLAQLGVWHFKRIREFVNNDKEFFDKLDKMIKTVPFNAYHYNLQAFYKKNRPGYDFSMLKHKIEEIRLK